MIDFVKLQLPGTEPSTIYIEVSRIVTVKDTNMESQTKAACCRIEFQAGYIADGDQVCTLDAYNVVGAAEEIIDQIHTVMLNAKRFQKSGPY